MEILTKEIAKTICDKVFPQETKDILKITLADDTEIELYKQFWKYFKNRPLKYDLEETIMEAARIYEYTHQDVLKYKLYKEKRDLLNKPESFFDTAINISGAEGDNSGLDAKESTFKGDTKTLNIGKTDSASKSNSKTMSRAGDSSLNEDFTDIEDNWKDKDKEFNGLLAESQLDITLNADTPLDVNKASVVTQPKATPTPPTTTPTPQEGEAEASEDLQVSYTNISLNKGLVGSQESSLNSSKSLSSSSKSMENRNKSLNTSMWKKSGKVMQSKFSYGEKTMTALNYFVTNFKESFFSSFNSLFIPVWGGYGQHSL